jgi:hypothetical protein
MFIATWANLVISPSRATPSPGGCRSCRSLDGLFPRLYKHFAPPGLTATKSLNTRKIKRNNVGAGKTRPYVVALLRLFFKIHQSESPGVQIASAMPGTSGRIDSISVESAGAAPSTLSPASAF